MPTNGPRTRPRYRRAIGSWPLGTATEELLDSTIEILLLTLRAWYGSTSQEIVFRWDGEEMTVEIIPYWTEDPVPQGVEAITFERPDQPPRRISERSILERQYIFPGVWHRPGEQPIGRWERPARRRE